MIKNLFIFHQDQLNKVNYKSISGPFFVPSVKVGISNTCTSPSENNGPVSLSVKVSGVIVIHLPMWASKIKGRSLKRETLIYIHKQTQKLLCAFVTFLQGTAGIRVCPWPFSLKGCSVWVQITRAGISTTNDTRLFLQTMFWKGSLYR